MNFFQTKFLSTVSLDTLNPILRALPENFISESEFLTQKLFWKNPMERWTLFQQTLRHDLDQDLLKFLTIVGKNFIHYIVFFGGIIFFKPGLRYDTSNFVKAADGFLLRVGKNSFLETISQSVSLTRRMQFWQAGWKLFNRNPNFSFCSKSKILLHQIRKIKKNPFHTLFICKYSSGQVECSSDVSSKIFLG